MWANIGEDVANMYVCIGICIYAYNVFTLNSKFLYCIVYLNEIMFCEIENITKKIISFHIHMKNIYYIIRCWHMLHCH